MLGGDVFRNCTARSALQLFESVNHCTLLISEHQAPHGVWLKLALTLATSIYVIVICMQHPTYDVMIQSISLKGGKLDCLGGSFPLPLFVDETLTVRSGYEDSLVYVCIHVCSYEIFLLPSMLFISI